MDAPRFDDRTPRGSDMRGLAVVLGGLLILLVGAVIFLIFTLNSGPAPVAAIASGSPSLIPSGSPAGSPSMGLGTPVATVASAAVPTPTPTLIASQIVVPPTTSPTAPPTASPTPTPAAPLAGDEPADALAISSLPYSLSIDVRRATEGTSDRRCDDERQSNDTVWFKYTATADGDLGAYTAGSEYGTVLVVDRLNGDGSTEMIGCNVWSPQDGSAVRLAAKSGVTYLFMVGSTGRRSGEVHFALENAPKAAVVEADLSPSGTFDNLGNVNLWLTTRCSGDIQYVSVEIELRQVVDREVHTEYDYWDLSNCRHEQTWNLELNSYDFVFGPEPATAFVTISYSDRFENHYLQFSADVELDPELGTFPSPSPSF